MKIPEHIGIIMDGNGRWATRRGLVRSAGHAMGVSALRRIVHECYDLGVKTLTVYAFSTENWQRPQQEIDALMELLVKYLKNYREELGERDIRLVAMGDVSKFSPEIQLELAKVEQATKNNTTMVFNICLNYGGRAEIVNATKKLMAAEKAGDISAEDISEDMFSRYLYGISNHDVDLIIRTSGEFRISNFLLWQSAYSEFWVAKKMFPAWTKRDLHKAIKAYNKRERRKGGLSEA